MLPLLMNFCGYKKICIFWVAEIVFIDMWINRLKKKQRVFIHY